MAARKKAATTRKPDDEKNLDEVFTDKRKKDAEQVKLGRAATHIKECHLLSKECSNRLATARLDTSTMDAILHDLSRVVELCYDMQVQAEKAIKALPL